MRGIRSYNKVCKFLDKTHTQRRQHEPKKYHCSGQRTNTRSCSCNMPIFDKNFPGLRRGCICHEYSRILLALASRSRIHRRIHVHTAAQIAHWIHSLNFASRRMLWTRTVTFFYKILLTKGSPSYSRSTADMWYTLTKIHERLWTERIPLYSIRIFQVYVTYCVRLEYSRILLRHNHIFESRIL